jgi:hypothetical protein
MFRLLIKKRGSIIHAGTGNLCDLLEKIMSKGMFISSGDYPFHRRANILHRTGIKTNGKVLPANNIFIEKMMALPFLRSNKTVRLWWMNSHVPNNH